MAQRDKAEEELRRLSVEMRYLEQTAETLQQRIGMVNAAITDLTYANMTLDGIEKEKENAELLVPIGGSSYVKVKLADSNKVIVGMGAGVSIEKTLQETKTTLKELLLSGVHGFFQFTQPFFEGGFCFLQGFLDGYF